MGALVGPEGRLVCLTGAACFLAALAVAPARAERPIQITADLTDAPRHLYHAEIDIPVHAGPVDLITPQWIPGDHMPSGPVSDIVDVELSAGGKKLVWRRDDVNLFEFHAEVPAGANTLHAHLDCIVTDRVSQELAVLEWEKLLLYPAHVAVRDIAIQASLKVPAGWGVGTALEPAGGGAWPVPENGSTTQFAATNVEQLEDSPVMTGKYFKEIPLAPSIAPKHFLDVFADYPEEIALRPQMIADTENLVREADALYGSHHYHSYHFLLTMSDVAGGEGLEHGQSSDNGVEEKGYADDPHELKNADLLTHEFTHSWNGKYRRPVGLYQPDFATPQQGALLWVYEGMTQYLGYVLAARSGFYTPQQFRDTLAIEAAKLDATPGREWRSTGDTAIAASILRDDGASWANLRRGQDYYHEGMLLWLDADTLIRQLTKDQKSLDDFARIFFGKGGNTGPLIVTYTFDELVTDLNQVTPYDWASFLHERVDLTHERANVAGFERGGYRLVYRDSENATEKSLDDLDKGENDATFWYSIGLKAANDGTISDVRANGPSDAARVAPGWRILAVNDEVFSTDVLRKAVREAKLSKEPIRLILAADKYIRTAAIDYHDGERFPVLEPMEGGTKFLDEIAMPRIKPQ